MKKEDKKIFIFDTTLRDGEQCPGASMTEDEKIMVAKQLARLKVDIIEAGFPISSPVQFSAVERISREIEGPVIAALARAVKDDIIAAHKALMHAKKKRIHTFIATSEIHMKHKLNKKPSEVLQMAVDAIKMARDMVDDVEFSAEDATRSDIIYLTEIVEAAIEAGASTINIPDTVGYITPNEYAEIFKTLHQKVKNADRVIFSTHCHNDLGLAVANSLTAVLNGARQIECTVNGIGERAGNTAVEEVVMAVQTRNNIYPFSFNLDAKQIHKSSKLISKVTGMVVQPNKAIVGANAFAHESGIHQHGIIKNRLTYEIMTPESIGLEGSRLVLGRHSGRAGFKQKVTELGIELNENDLNRAYERFLIIADKKKEIYEDDIIALIDDEVARTGQETYQLEYFQITSGTTVLPIAAVKIKNTEKGTSHEVEVEAVTGDGPVSALFRAIEKAVNITTKLEVFNITPITIGKDALGEARVGLKVKDSKIFYGRGTSTDIIEACAKAFIEALNKYKKLGA
ncbi:MAG: 2-isopropylmalate synthase [Spirochaetia bacterium]|nr:2-isopropylmalate synthase [Spirochaetia bacterium]